jgi:hypothetical protein
MEAENFSESHALEDAWTLWFQKQRDTGTVNPKSWLEGLTEIMTFSTVCVFSGTLLVAHPLGRRILENVQQH